MIIDTRLALLTTSEKALKVPVKRQLPESNKKIIDHDSNML